MLIVYSRLVHLVFRLKHQKNWAPIVLSYNKDRTMLLNLWILNGWKYVKFVVQLWMSLRRVSNTIGLDEAEGERGRVEESTKLINDVYCRADIWLDTIPIDSQFRKLIDLLSRWVL